MGTFFFIKVIFVFSLLFVLDLFAQSDLSPYFLSNLGQISEGLYRGDTMKSQGDYKFLSEELEIDDVINLRYWHRDNKVLCNKYGFNCHDYPILLFFLGDSLFDMKTFKRAYYHILELQKNGRRVYIHCLHGSDRTGALVAAIKIRQTACGESFDKSKLWENVKTELEKYHFHKIFFSLYQRIKNWIFEFEKNQWLCEN